MPIFRRENVVDINLSDETIGGGFDARALAEPVKHILLGRIYEV